MMTPILNPASDAEERHNTSQMRARNTVEHARHIHTTYIHDDTHMTHAHDTCTQHMHTTRTHDTCTHDTYT